MKKIVLLSSMLVASVLSPAFSQVRYEQQIQVPTIEVAGFAEIEVVPDEIYFNISLGNILKMKKPEG
jgi:uncharacterized protein YggE